MMFDWALPDPKGLPLQTVRAVRDEIHDGVKELIRSECAECCKGSGRLRFSTLPSLSRVNPAASSSLDPRLTRSAVDTAFVPKS